MSTATLRVWPDFLIIGAKRCGTTSLYGYLLGHPHVAPLVPRRQHLKGLYFFDVNFGRGTTWYRSHFPTAASMSRLRAHRGTAITGEASPYYLAHPLTPARASSLLPDARILVLLRNPVDRAFSHYREQVRRGVETLSFSDAIDAESSRLAGEVERLRRDPSAYSHAHEHLAYVSRGDYADQLARWMEVYPRDQILIVRSEDLYADPGPTYACVDRFLGLPPHGRTSWPRYNFHPGSGVDPAVRARLAERYREPNRRLEELVGRRFSWD